MESKEKKLRLNKFLADTLGISRREADRLIQQKSVEINSKLIKEPYYRVDIENDKVFFNGEKLEYKNQTILLILNKPRFYITTKKDPQKRRTVYELLDKKYHSLKYIGRLDYESRGLLIFTNKGELIEQLSRPIYKIPKTYKVIINKPIRNEDIKKLQNGIILKPENIKTKKAEVKKLSNRELLITITEGKKRQIRRMLQSVGYRVVDLQRIRFGKVELKNLDLKEGEYKVKIFTYLKEALNFIV